MSSMPSPDPSTSLIYEKNLGVYLNISFHMKYIHYILKNKGAWRYKGADHRAVGMLLHNPSRRGYMKKMWELWNLLYLTSRLTVKQLVVQCNIWKRQLISQLEINEVQHICYGRGWGGRTSSLRLGTKVQQQLVRWRCWVLRTRQRNKFWAYG